VDERAEKGEIRSKAQHQRLYYMRVRIPVRSTVELFWLSAWGVARAKRGKVMQGCPPLLTPT
jgi:hypothetical protein